MRTMNYHPPSLNRKIVVRSTRERPVVAIDDAGNEIETPVWGDEVWANVRDANPLVDVGDSQIGMSKRTIFTIRKRTVDDTTEVVFDGSLYRMQGDSVFRGGPNAGMNQEYMELHCEWEGEV